MRTVHQENERGLDRCLLERADEARRAYLLAAAEYVERLPRSVKDILKDGARGEAKSLLRQQFDSEGA